MVSLRNLLSFRRRAMPRSVDFETMEHDPCDPNPWLALYLDHSTPIDPQVKEAWLRDSSSRCRQFILPVVRPFARGTIIVFQVIKIVLPNALTSSWLLHRLLAWALYTFVRPENEVALALLRRYGYAETTVLKNHIFGQDYCVMEKPYTKVTEGYDHGVGAGRVGRMIARLNELLGR